MLPSPTQQLDLLNSAKTALQKDRTFLDFCQEHDLSPSFIDLIPVKFGPLEVSGKTEHGIITLNQNLLSQNLEKITGYLLHEAIHAAQMLFEGPTQGAEDGDYLENPFELESFQNQISFIDDHEGESKADSYVEQLLNHHHVSNPQERQEKKKNLLKKIETI